MLRFSPARSSRMRCRGTQRRHVGIQTPLPGPSWLHPLRESANSGVAFIALKHSNHVKNLKPDPTDQKELRSYSAPHRLLRSGHYPMAQT